MTRRSFLKGLLSLPLIAAVPKFAALAEALPVVEPVQSERDIRFHESWLRINGHPVECSTLTVDSGFDVIETRSMNGMRIMSPGLLRNTLRARLHEFANPILRDLFYARNTLNIEARFGLATLYATGYLTECNVYAYATELPGADVTIELTQVRYEEHDQA